MKNKTLFIILMTFILCFSVTSGTILFVQVKTKLESGNKDIHEHHLATMVYEPTCMSEGYTRDYC